eukprot:7505475-Pyramimonas_sp.AAC.1
MAEPPLPGSSGKSSALEPQGADGWCPCRRNNARTRNADYKLSPISTEHEHGDDGLGVLDVAEGHDMQTCTCTPSPR